ncbi:unnamed protein product [Effrenium voratum]|uniref:Uncharacterized protein n=1 Tax=Effrenium voratum TaxID=2562239 RepID=A0AA36JMP4_9DINO|nr:unnamed protein product [Effrenium voratum]
MAHASMVAPIPFGGLPSRVLEKTTSAPAPVMESHLEDSAKLVRTRTLSVVSTDSSTSAQSPSSTPFMSPASVGSTAYMSPAVGDEKLELQRAPSFPPPGFAPGLVLGELPRSSSVQSVGLQRSISVKAPYPPGLGFTPQHTPSGGLQRKISFGLTDEPKLRRMPTDLDMVNEHEEERQYHRELLLFFAAACPPVEKLPWPQPGALRVMAGVQPPSPPAARKAKEPKKETATNRPSVPEEAPESFPAETAKETKDAKGKGDHSQGGAQARHAKGKGAGGQYSQDSGKGGWKGWPAAKGYGWKGWSKGWPSWNWY